MSRTRPYLVRIGGKTRMVEGTSREQAIGHVTRPLVEECKAASAKEVMEFARDGGTIEKAGVYPAPEGPIPIKRQPQVGDAILELDAEVEIVAGDILVPVADNPGMYRKMAEGDSIEGAVTVPGGFVQHGRCISWTPAPEGEQNPAPEGS